MKYEDKEIIASLEKGHIFSNKQVIGLYFCVGSYFVFTMFFIFFLAVVIYFEGLTYIAVCLFLVILFLILAIVYLYKLLYRNKKNNKYVTTYCVGFVETVAYSEVVEIQQRGFQFAYYRIKVKFYINGVGYFKYSGEKNKEVSFQKIYRNYSNRNIHILYSKENGDIFIVKDNN